MTDRQNGLGLTAAVGAGCLGLLLLVIALIARTEDSEQVNPALGFPLIMAGVVVLATALALGWRAVSKKKQSSDSR
jgi:Kef-type K+ transport system membrane component KefB